MICLTVSHLARPHKDLQLNVLIESASVIGVLTKSKFSKIMIPLFDRTQFHILAKTSSPLLKERFLALPPQRRAIDPLKRLIGPQTQLIITFRAER